MNQFPGVSTVSGGATAVAGSAAEDAATTANPVIVGGLVRTATSPTTLVAGDAARATMSSAASVVILPYAVPEATWSYVAAANGIANTTTAVTIRAAAAAGLRNYVTNIQLMSDTLALVTELAVRDGAAGPVLWRTKIGTAGVPSTINITFNVPLRGTAATLLEVVTLTSNAGAVYFNAQGFVAP